RRRVCRAVRRAGDRPDTRDLLRGYGAQPRAGEGDRHDHGLDRQRLRTGAGRRPRPYRFHRPRPRAVAAAYHGGIMSQDLATVIDSAWDARADLGFGTTGEVRDAVDSALELLDAGEARVAEPDGAGG